MEMRFKEFLEVRRRGPWRYTFVQIAETFVIIFYMIDKKLYLGTFHAETELCHFRVTVMDISEEIWQLCDLVNITQIVILYVKITMVEFWNEEDK